MLTLFILAVFAAFHDASLLNVSHDTQAIVFAICIASDLNLLFGGSHRR